MEDGLKIDDRLAGAPPVIVRTKFAPPQLREDFVHRSELVDRVLTSTCRLTVVSSAAGTGKSTLMAQVHDAEPCSVWLSIDQADNDPVVLWWGLIGCLGEQLDDFGSTYRNRLLSGGPGVVDAVVASVLNELAEAPEPVRLFVDDVGRLEDTVCRQSLHRFVRGLPPGCKMVVACRGVSPIPLARFRVEGDVLEITGSDLAMSHQEARQLLDRLRPNLDAEDVHRLAVRTEGWPAGLQLAGMALTDTVNVGAFVANFQGTDRLVADYLMTEVIATLPITQQQFLLSTAPLQRMCGELCDAVTGGVATASVLRDLARNNAFVVPLDRTDTWFRYHHLFSEFLTSELLRSDPDRAHEVNKAAFEWLREHQYLIEAIDHGMAADEVTAAADMVAEHYFGLFNTGRLKTVLLLLERFDDEQIAEHQPLAIAAAFSHAMAGNHARAREYIDAAGRASYDGTPPDGTVSMAASLALVRSCLAHDGIDRAVADAQYVHTAEPSASPWRAYAALVIGLGEVMRGDLEASMPYLREARDSPDEAIAAYALAELAVVAHRQGANDQALALASEAQSRLIGLGLEDNFVAATANGILAVVNVALGTRNDARHALQAGARPMAAAGQAMPMDTMQAALLLAEAALELGDLVVARNYLNRATQVAAEVGDTGTMGPQLARLSKRLRQMGSERGHLGISSDPVTPRELEVLALLRHGLTTRQIGEELYLSRNTVKTYLRRLYRKLGVASRSEAVEQAHRLGLVDAPRAPGAANR